MNEVSSRRHLPRASLACDACKARKTRCDARQPICHACERRGLSRSCTWNAPRRRRLKHVSQRESSDSFPSTRDERLGPLPSWTATGGLPVQREPRVTFDQSALEQPLPNPDLTGALQTPPESTVTQAENGDGLATLPARNDRSVYGPSSTIAFVRDIFPAPSRPPSPSQPTRDVDDATTPLEKAEKLVKLSKSAAVLPLRRDADDYLHCYWEFIHPMFPVLHRPSFLKLYEQLWSGVNDDADIPYLQGVDELVFTSTLNIVFALGCQFSSHIQPVHRSATANDFYQRSRLFLLFEILDSTHLSLVQAMILTGVYLQSTQHANRCWNSVGIAIRIAQSLGLHLDHAGKSAVPQLEREMRRRVWHTCVNLDRLLAMTFGRPTMLSNSWRVPTPALIDDEFLGNTAEGTQPEGTPSVLGLFISSCGLFEILEDVLSSFYGPNAASGADRIFDTSTMASQLIDPILQINRRIDCFMTSVPSYLSITGKTDFTRPNHNSVHLQQQVLYCRSLYVRLLSLRPLLIQVTVSARSRSSPSGSTETEQMSLDAAIIRQCCTLCVETGIRLIETIEENLNTLYRSTGWHSVYFAFASTTVLLAACRCPEVYLLIGSPVFETAWLRCIHILRHYEEQIESAAQAISVLEAMRNQIVRLQSQENTRNGQLQGLSHRPINPGLNIAANNEVFSDPFDFSAGDLFPAESMSDAWFAQQLNNLDWLDSTILPQPP